MESRSSSNLSSMTARRKACMHKIFVLLLVSCLVPVLSHDVGVLMFLNDAFGDPPILSSWSWAKEPCEPPWFGVKECNQTSGCHTIGDATEDMQNCRVLALDLSSLGLGGVISYVVGDSFRLQFLDLSNNSIGGPLPTGKQGISELQDLQYFNVSHNQLNGSLPYDIGYMYSLQTVDLSHNNFTGELPLSLGVLATGGNLTYLDLTGNSFTGYVPSEVKLIPILKLTSPEGGNSGLCNEAVPGLPPCLPGTNIPGLNYSDAPLPQLSPGALAPVAPRASVWGSAILPVEESPAAPQPAPAPAAALSGLPAPANVTISSVAPNPANTTTATSVAPSTFSAPITGLTLTSPVATNAPAASSKTPGSATGASNVLRAPNGLLFWVAVWLAMRLWSPQA